MGHSVRSCIIGMRVAEELDVSVEDKGDLFYALLLKDAGCSSNSSKLFHILCADEIRAKRDVKLTDWTRLGWESLQYAVTHVATEAKFLDRVRTLVQVAARQQVESCELVKIRCERGASIARRLGFPEPVAQGIHSLDEHWNGGGYPDHLRGEKIPLFSRIMNLAQTLEVFFVNDGAETALKVAESRNKRWFDPDLVRAALSLAHRGVLWERLEKEQVLEDALRLEPEDRRMVADDRMVENLCQAFSEIIDAKTPFTYRHSFGVAEAATSICQQFSLGPEDTTFIRRAALLHDIGKLSVSNCILEKPASLDNSEWEVVKKHPYYSYEILRRIPGFEELAEVAGAHHEKLDGSGYFRHYTGEQMSLATRIMVVSDIFDALSAKRPYRDALPLEKTFEIMRSEAPKKLDADCLEALIVAQTNRPSMSADLAKLSAKVEGERVEITQQQEAPSETVVTDR
jgi:putative nucleotidyltransferase with HDIG domain